MSRASVANPDQVDAFSSIRSSDGALTIMAINKNLYDPNNPNATTTITIDLSNFASNGVAQEWQLAALNPSDQTKAAIKAKYKRGLGNTVFSAAVQSFVDQGAVLRIEESSREVWYQVARPKAAKAVSAAHGDPKLGPEGPEGPESAPLGGGTLGTRTVRSGMSPGLSGPMQLKRVSRL